LFYFKQKSSDEDHNWGLNLNLLTRVEGLGIPAASSHFLALFAISCH